MAFACPPDGHADIDGHDDEPTRGSDERALDEDVRRGGVVETPPPEEGGRQVERPAENGEPRRSELRLETEFPCDIFGGTSGGGEHDQEDGEDLAPEDFCRGHYQPIAFGE